jgi:hypothetical protein
MNSADYLLAMFEPLPDWLDFLAMALAIAFVGLGALLWIVFFRKKIRRRRKHHRRHHREEYKPNPTLAQSGGLPPVREEKNTDAPTSPP